VDRETPVYGEGRVQEEQAESESGKESGKEECRILTECYREKERRRERSTAGGTGMPLRKWKE
jgi:hypothetical protein